MAKEPGEPKQDPSPEELTAEKLKEYGFIFDNDTWKGYTDEDLEEKLASFNDLIKAHTHEDNADKEALKIIKEINVVINAIKLEMDIRETMEQE